jgi:hypothetical protein
MLAVSATQVLERVMGREGEKWEGSSGKRLDRRKNEKKYYD